MDIIQPRPTHIIYQCAKFGDDRASFNVIVDERERERERIYSQPIHLTTYNGCGYPYSQTGCLPMGPYKTKINKTIHYIHIMQQYYAPVHIWMPDWQLE